MESRRHNRTNFPDRRPLIARPAPGCSLFGPYITVARIPRQYSATPAVRRAGTWEKGSGLSAFVPIEQFAQLHVLTFQFFGKAFAKVFDFPIKVCHFI